MYYEFTDDLLTHNELIDNEHKVLVNSVNDLFVYLNSWEENEDKVNETIFFITNYVSIHFGHENTLLRESEHPETQQHIDWHNNFRSEVRVLTEELFNEGPSESFIERLVGKIASLIHHIKTDDKSLAEHIRKNKNIR